MNKEWLVADSMGNNHQISFRRGAFGGASKFRGDVPRL